MSLNYTCTNESLKAIVKGLDLKDYDIMLAVCGSGDQAFAMLEYVNEVLAIDNNQDQVDFARNRAELLRKGKYGKFLSFAEEQSAEEKRRAVYFNKDRLNIIRSKLDNIRIEKTDLREINYFGEFTKLYLSNALTFGNIKSDEISEIGIKIYETLPVDGLIYNTGYDFPSNKGNFSIENTLSRIARKHESKDSIGWNPTVYRKIK